MTIMVPVEETTSAGVTLIECFAFISTSNYILALKNYSLIFFPTTNLHFMFYMRYSD